METKSYNNANSKERLKFEIQRNYSTLPQIIKNIIMGKIDVRVCFREI